MLRAEKATWSSLSQSQEIQVFRVCLEHFDKIFNTLFFVLFLSSKRKKKVTGVGVVDKCPLIAMQHSWWPILKLFIEELAAYMCHGCIHMSTWPHSAWFPKWSESLCWPCAAWGTLSTCSRNSSLLMKTDPKNTKKMPNPQAHHKKIRKLPRAWQEAEGGVGLKHARVIHVDDWSLAATAEFCPLLWSLMWLWER